MNNRAYYGNNIPNSPIYNENIIPKEQVINDSTLNNKFQVTTNYDLPIDIYIENLLRFNRGKEVKVYMSFPNSNEKEFTGIMELSGKDFIIISEPSTGKWQMLPIMYLDYITFDEKINYN